jgi:hypothetical protein
MTLGYFFAHYNSVVKFIHDWTVSLRQKSLNLVRCQRRVDRGAAVLLIDRHPSKPRV